MHELFSRVLDKRDLSKAGDLFNIDDAEVVLDLESCLQKLTEIFDAKSYVNDANSQSVVEICLARITSAIRETNSIETYASCLVELLESCIRHNLSRTECSDEDSPHAKLASDLLSCIFLHYGKKSVMTLAIPAAVKVLQKGNRDLVRNTSSYLALAAIHNGRLISQYATSIINSISNGNYSLLRLLPQIYSDNEEPFYAHLSTIIDCLDVCDTAEKLAVLNLCSMIVARRSELLAPHAAKFRNCLFSPNSCSAVLHIYLSLTSAGHSIAVADQMNALKRASEMAASSHIRTIAKIVAAIGKLNKSLAREAVAYLVVRCAKIDDGLVPVLLKDVEPLARLYPDAVRPYLPEIAKLTAAAAAPSVKLVADSIAEYCDESRRSEMDVSNDKITLISVNGDAVSNNSSWSKESLSSSTSTAKPGAAHSSQTLLNPAAPLSPMHVEKAYHLHHHRPTILNCSPYYSPPTYSECLTSASAAGIRSKSYNNLAPLRTQKSSTRAYRANRAKQLEKIRRELQPTFAPIGDNCVELSIRGQRNSVYLYPMNCVDEERFAFAALEMNAAGRVMPLSARNRRPLLGENGCVGEGGGVSCLLAADVSLDSSSSSTRETSSRVVTTFNKDKSITQRTGSGSTLTVQIGTDMMTKNHLMINVDAPTSTPSSPRMVDAFTQSTATLGSRLSTQGAFDVEYSLTEKGADAIKQFCEKHLHKIKTYVCDLSTKYPVPCRCTVEESAAHKHHVRIHFSCQDRSEHCLHLNSNLFAFKTKYPQIWLHLMFLHLQAQCPMPLNNNCDSIKDLRRCWECLPIYAAKSKAFTALVTSMFPDYKEQRMILKELQLARYFDLFAYNADKKKWCCFACNHPEKVQTFLKQGDAPVIEGQLKEKKGRWKFFKRWRTRYFTLSGAALSYRGSVSESFANPAIDLRSIRSVKSLNGRKGRRTIPKAFEIFIDDDRSYVLKARDRKNAEEWFQCLQIAVAQAQKDRRISSL